MTGFSVSRPSDKFRVQFVTKLLYIPPESAHIQIYLEESALRDTGSDNRIIFLRIILSNR